MSNSISSQTFRNITILFFLIKLFIHLYTNAFEGYGIFRDELYLYACSLRPDLGYVDQPPLSVWMLKVFSMVFGKSVFAIRFVPALLGALCIIPLAMSVRQLGGKKIALMITLSAFVISPIYLAYCGYYSMNSIDMLLWNVILLLVIKINADQNPKLWIALGALMGLALMNKIGMLWFGLGLLISLLITHERHWLSTRWPYLAGALALLIFSPYIIWNATHHWPTIEFLGSVGEKYSTQSITTFLSGQLLINNPSNIIVWLAGIVFFIFMKRGRNSIQLFTIFMTILIILLINGHSKPEYLAQIFVVLFIGGGLAIEQWTTKRKWVAYLVIVNQFIGILSAPLAIPILPVEKYISFAKFVGIAPSTGEGHQLAELPQFYADMFGWENQAKAIAKVYHNLSEAQKAQCAIFGDNYGRAGAVDYYADKYDLPHSIGSHNNYWIWGPDQYSGELLIVLSSDVGDKATLFEEVIEMGEVYTPYAIPYENNLKVYLCKNLRQPVEDLWPKIKNYN